jgi:hypothetical protein
VLGEGEERIDEDAAVAAEPSLLRGGVDAADAIEETPVAAILARVLS